MLGGLAFCLLVSGQVKAQPVYYNTSSANPSQNTLSSVGTDGSSNTVLFTAGGPVSRCTAMAVDALNGKLFLLDGQANALWRVNLDGTGLTLIKSGLTSFPSDLALDVLNQKIFLTTSSTVQADNTVQSLDYTGAGHSVLFTATGAGGNGVSRCTAMALDLLHSRMFIADAGAQKVWRLDSAGNGLVELAATANSYPTGLAVDPTNQHVYFTASSAAQAFNSVQRVGYDGSGLTTTFAASGAVQRCTALDLDLRGANIYLSDAGANALWRIPLGGGSAALVLSGLPATAKKVRWFGGSTSRPPPGLTQILLSGANAVLSATNGFAGGTYYVLTTTNLATPLAQWIPILTNVLTTSGSFALTASNTVDVNSPRRFFILAVH